VWIMGGVVGAVIMSEANLSMHGIDDSIARAAHRHGGQGDIPDTGVCDEGNDAAIEHTDELLELGSPILLEGDWNVVEPTGGGFVGQVRVTPGLGDYTFPVTAHFGTCVNKFQIVGIENGEKFVITGPCSPVVDSPVTYVMKLVDPKTGDPEEPDLAASPIENIMAGEFRIREIAAGTAFAAIKLHGFNGGIPLSGVVKSTEWGFTNSLTFEFTQDGAHELEMVWEVPAPPNGKSRTIVSSAFKRVLVVPAGSKFTVTDCRADSSATCVTRTDSPGSFTIMGRQEARPRMDPTPTASEPEAEVEITVKHPGLSNFKIGFLAEREAGSGGHEAAVHQNVAGSGPSNLTDGQWATHPHIPIGFHKDGAFHDASAGEVKGVYKVTAFGGRERVRIFVLPSGERFRTIRPNGSIEFDAEMGGLTHDEQQQQLKLVVGSGRFAGCHLGTIEIDVKVKDEFGNDLEALGQRMTDEGITNITLVGGTCEHHGPRNDNLLQNCRTPDNNHFGRINLNDSIIDVASEFEAWTGDNLLVNDMSLGEDGEGYGGRFDLDGEWEASTSHDPEYGHSNGSAADLDASNVDDIVDVLTDVPFNYAEISTSDPFTPNAFIDEVTHIHLMK